MMISVASLLLTAAVAATPDPPAGKYAAALVAGDGVRATLYRYRPEGARHAPAILLLPDVGMTHRSYDLGGRGLARFLFENGVEVFVLEYRGTGRSELPAGGYRLEELRLDAEAALRRVLADRGEVVLGGCGFGATLAFLLAGADPAHVSAVVALQPVSTLDFPNEPVARAFAGELPPWVDVPELAREALFGRTWFEVMLTNDGGIGPSDTLGVSRRVLAPVPRALVLQIGEAMRSRRLTLDGGEDVRLGMARHRGRTLLLLAPRDNWIHPEFASPLLPLLDPARTQVRVLSRAEGSRLDYGHLGMLLAAEAARDVHLPVLRFLQDEGARR